MQLALLQNDSALQLKVLSDIWHFIWAEGLAVQIISISPIGNYLRNGSFLFKSQVLGGGPSISDNISESHCLVSNCAKEEHTVHISFVSTGPLHILKSVQIL